VTHIIRKPKKEYKKKWTDARMRQFCFLYMKDKQIAIDEFKLTPKSATVYFNKFKRELGIMNTSNK